MRRSALRRCVPRPTYANVIATVALFIALGGVAVAAGLPRNSVGPNQLKRGAVTPAKIRKQAVTSGKLAAGAVTPGKIGANAVLPGNLGNGIITTQKIAAGAVIASTIKNGVVTNAKLANNSVNTQKLADNAVNANKLADKAVTPAKLSFATSAPGTVSNLASGQTLRGNFDLGTTAAEAGEIVKAAIGYSMPLANPATVTVLLPGQTTASCPGLGAGNSTPAATAGNACLYVTEASNLADAVATEGLVAEANTRLGFGLSAKAKEAKKPFFAIGQWAVTAP
jgi:trimeric autotransporter adhesin